MTHERLERRVLLLTRCTIGTTALLIICLLLAASAVHPVLLDRVQATVVRADTVYATVVVTQRLDVVEADGTQALVAASSEQMPGVVFAGDTVTTRGGSAGMIFFYKGSEVGGLTYRIDEFRDPPYALGHLSMDQYQQDQVALMQYDGQGDRQRAGFYINDRSTDFSLYDYKALIDSVRLLPEADQAAVMGKFAARDEAGEFGGRRVALESNKRVAALRLSDWSSRERLRAIVDSTGNARIEFLDAGGNVVRAITAEE